MPVNVMKSPIAKTEKLLACVSGKTINHEKKWKYFYGVFTLDDTENETETDKKMACIGLCGGIHTAQRPMTTQIPIGFCVLVIGIGLGLVLGVAQCE